MPVHRRAFRGQAAHEAENDRPPARRREPFLTDPPEFAYRGLRLNAEGHAHFQGKGAALRPQHAVHQIEIIGFLLQHGLEGLGRARQSQQGFVENVPRLEHPDAVGQAQGVEHRVNGAKGVQLALEKRFDHTAPPGLVMPARPGGVKTAGAALRRTDASKNLMAQGTDQAPPTPKRLVLTNTLRQRRGREKLKSAASALFLYKPVARMYKRTFINYITIP